MDRAEVVQAEAMAVEEISHLDDVLVEGAAFNVGMHTPNRMDERFAGNDDPLVFMDVSKDAQFLAADFFILSLGEFDFQAQGHDARAAKFEGFVHDPHVFREVHVARGFGTAQHGADAGDEFGEAKGLGDVIVSSQFKPADFVYFQGISREENRGYEDVVAFEVFEQGEAGLIGQVDVQQQQVGEVLL